MIENNIIFLNQKPWVNGDGHAKLKARADTYKSGDLVGYRDSRYALQSAISSAKRQDRVESHYQCSNTRNMWAGLKTIIDNKRKSSIADVVSAALPEELNTFYAGFESSSPAVEVQEAQEDRCPPVISRADLCRSLKWNTHKAPGPPTCTAPVCSPHMHQGDHHCPCSQENKNPLPEQLLPSSSHLHHYEVL